MPKNKGGIVQLVKMKLDSWTNVLTGIGTMRDKAERTTFSIDGSLSDETLIGIYQSGGVGRRVVELPAKEMTRRWITIDGDEEGLVVQKLETLGARAQFNEAIRWARLFGGSLMVIGADDSGLLEMPLNETGLRDIHFLRVFDLSQVTAMEFETDPSSPNYGLPRYYQITPLSPGVSHMFNVHHSRVIRFDGAPIPDRLRVSNLGWGDSCLQAVYTDLRGLGVGYKGVEHILSDFSRGVLTISNLAGLLADSEGQRNVLTRIEMLDMSAQIANTMIVDEGEKYERHTTAVSGLSDLIDRLKNRVSAVTGIPVTVLFGESPGGMNATGESDIRNWYDSIASDQVDLLTDPLERLVRLIQLCKDGPMRGRELESWSVQFNPLWQPTEKQEADRRLVVAQTDAIYLSAGVLEPEEVAASRFGGDTFSPETELMYDRTADDFDIGDNPGDGGKTGEPGDDDGGKEPPAPSAE